MATPTSPSPYIVYFQKILPPWMQVSIQQDIGVFGYFISMRVTPWLLIDDEYGKMIEKHEIGAMVQVTQLDNIRELKLDKKFMEQVDAYMKAATFDEYDYDDEGNRIEESKRIRKFTNWVIIHDGFPMYMKGISPEADDPVTTAAYADPEATTGVDKNANRGATQSEGRKD